ncbi:glycosyltransferase [Candidatus Bathyarchaeota archaeon]|nr:glycosyltransferase [Candidatus Bathyarchaeota archaeon]
MNIAIAHHSLNIPGGAERLCIATIEALLRKNHEVTLITVEKTDWQTVTKNFGEIKLPEREVYLTTSKISKHLSNVSIASAYFMSYLAQLLISRGQKKYDLLLNTFGDIVNSIADITYVHFPLRAAGQLSQIPAFSNKPMWRFVAPLYGKLMRGLDLVSPGILLTNSKFMREVIKRFLNRNSLVVYPPVDVEPFSSKCYKNRKNGCTVVVVASYTPKRHLEQVPLIAKHAKSARFVIMGKADKYSLPILRRLKKEIKELDVENRVSLLQNVPFNKLLDVFSRSEVYLHVMPFDHFGISVVEAMASGCVPVVHRSGGPWSDILGCQQGRYGYSYDTAEEAGELIDMLVADENLRIEIASRAIVRAKKFEKNAFMNRIAEVVEKVAA